MSIIKIYTTLVFHEICLVNESVQELINPLFLKVHSNTKGDIRTYICIYNI